MTVALERPPLKSRPDLPGPFRISREQYHRMSVLGFFENRRVELIRGVVYEKARNSWPHTKSIHAIGEIFRERLSFGGWASLGNALACEDSEPEPDVAVYRGRMREYTNHPTPNDALLVVEVASESLEYDTKIKAKLYAEYSIPDYWVFDLENRQLWVFRDPIEGEYRTQFKLTEVASITPLAAPEAVIKIAEMLP